MPLNILHQFLIYAPLIFGIHLQLLYPHLSLCFLMGVLVLIYTLLIYIYFFRNTIGA